MDGVVEVRSEEEDSKESIGALESIAKALDSKVISQIHNMPLWSFNEYKSGTGKCPVSEWYEDLTPANKANTDRFMEIARKLDQLDMPHFKHVEELREARWRGKDRVPHRIFCDVLSGRYVTFLCGCTHKGAQYKPTHAYTTAVKRRDEIQDGKAITRELSF